MTPNNVKIQALMPDVGCGGGLPRSLPPRAVRSAGVFAVNCKGGFFPLQYIIYGVLLIMNFREHLNDEMKNAHFKKMYEEEKHLLELGLLIIEAREQKGLTQKELAQKSQVTQQQLSKIENGVNCNMLTFIKVSSALGFDLTLSA
jgi:DNA-binding XRE family transcriptional regulator